MCVLINISTCTLIMLVDNIILHQCYINYFITIIYQILLNVAHRHSIVSLPFWRYHTEEPYWWKQTHNPILSYERPFQKLPSVVDPCKLWIFRLSRGLRYLTYLAVCCMVARLPVVILFCGDGTAAAATAAVGLFRWVCVLLVTAGGNQKSFSWGAGAAHGLDCLIGSAPFTANIKCDWQLKALNQNLCSDCLVTVSAFW